MLIIWIAALLLSFNDSPPITPENVAQIEVVNRLAIIGTYAEELAFNPSISRELALAQNDGRVSIWDVTTAQRIAEWRVSETSLNAITYTPDGTQIITAADDGNVKVWDAITGNLMKNLTVAEQIPVVVDITPHGTIAVGYQDGRIRLWNNETGEIRLTLYGYYGEVVALDISPDEKRIVFGYAYGSIIIYWFDNIEQQQVYIEQILLARELYDLAFVPNPQPYDFLSSEYGLATINNFRSVQFWDAQYTITLHTWNTQSTMIYPISMSFNHEGTLLAVGGKATAAGGWCESNPCPIEIIQAQHDPNNIEIDLPILATLGEPQTGPVDVRFSNDDRFLASSFENGLVLIWGIPQ
jgi:WD40 repeat protein